MARPTSPEQLDPLAPPEWFTQALAVPVEQGRVEVEATSIAYRTWGSPGQQGVVLVHGGAAHAQWWDHVAPLLADRRRVVAIDLSGHGDSGRRETYGLDIWASEVLAVSEAAGLGPMPVLIGHSMGGMVVLRAGGLYGRHLTGVVAVDSPVRDLTPEERAAQEKRAFGPLHVYPSREAILARFRPMPDHGGTLAYVSAHVAAASIREVDGGWTWKFDPQIFTPRRLTSRLLSRLECRVALFRAEHGMVSPQMGETMYDRLGRVAPVIEIPDAGHHVMLDRPLALVTGLRTLLSDWDHSLPSPSVG